MHTYQSLTARRLLLWQTKNILIFASLSVLVVIAEEIHGDALAFAIPSAPVTVLGSVIGIYVSFRTNSAYDRWWEGRRLWGQLVNTSRHFAGEVVAYLPGLKCRQFCRELVLHHALYVHALRCELRGDRPSDDADVRRIASESEVTIDPSHPTVTVRLLRVQLEQVADLAREKVIDGWQLQSFDRTISTLLDVQGGCERIRNTPLPPAYALSTELLIRTYAVLLPLALVNELHWMAIPVSIVVCLALKLISEVGRSLEDPFTHSYEALPLQALSSTIERNLRDAIGDDAPPSQRPGPRGVVL
ncbi:MAG: bestrophin family ion channel [Polyangiales bacterium]